MFISIAHAAGEVGAATTETPGMADAFWTNMGLIGLMFVLFYLLLIRPQQKRMKEQRSMLDDLKKGDKVVTGGGLLGSVSKVISDTEVEIDLGGAKVTAMRYTIQTRLDDDAVLPTPSNDVEKAKATTKPAAKPAAKKKAPAAAKKTTTAKKAPSKKTGATKKTTSKTKKA